MTRALSLLASAALAVLVASGAVFFEAAGPAGAAYPGANGKIVFSERDPAQRNAIKRINPSGTGLGTLLSGPSTFLDANPAVSPDANRVAYDGGGTGGRGSEILKLNVSNRRITQITRNDAFDGHPTWSPDGTRVAFVRGEYIENFGVANTDIVVRKADGTGSTINLTNTPDQDEWAPAWSPDGGEIAFHAGGDVFVLDLGTGQRHKLTDGGGARSDGNPSWSPDGARLVFESYSEEGDSQYERIYTMDSSDGSDKRPLAQALYTAANGGRLFYGATYSPDGERIAFARTDEAGGLDRRRRAQLLTMDASDGSDKRVIYEVGGRGSSEDEYLFSPDWGVKTQR